MKRSILSLTALTAALLIGVGVGAVMFSQTSADQTPAVYSSAHGQRAEEQRRRIIFVHELAREFGLSPELVGLVDQFSRRHVDRNLPEWRLIQTPHFMTYVMLSIIQTESEGRPDAVGDDGRARGLTQIWVSTAQQYGVVSAKDLMDPAINIDYAFRHFRYLLRQYRGNLALVLYAWNRGEGRVNGLLRYGFTPANGYAARIFGAKQLKAVSTAD